MITADFVNGAIAGVMARFENEYGRTGTYYCEEVVGETEEDSYEIEFHIEEEMRMMLDSLNIQNVVELVWVDENPAVTFYTLCISYVLNGKLYVYNEAVCN